MIPINVVVSMVEVDGEDAAGAGEAFTTVVIGAWVVTVYPPTAIATVTAVTTAGLWREVATVAGSSFKSMIV